jgi:thiamine biosynthesis lipoprotein ApbE
MPKELDNAQRILSSQLGAIDLACSRFRDDSELSALNRAGGCPMAVSDLFANAIEVAIRAAVITDGAVDPTCGWSLTRLGYDRDYAKLADDTSALTKPAAPAAGWRCVLYDPRKHTVQIPAGVMLDLGATAKALAADLAADAIWRQVGCGVLVNLGGDIATAGKAPAGGWRVGVDDGITAVDARLPDGLSSRRDTHVIAIEGGGAATSGTAFRSWRRGAEVLHHIVVPSTGRSADVFWAAVSVAAANCVDANIASTASIIRGRSAAAWLTGQSLPARLVRPDGVVVTTGGWPK